MKKGLLLVLLAVLIVFAFNTVASAAIDRVDLQQKVAGPVKPKGTIQFIAKAYEGDKQITTAKFTWSCKPEAGKISSTGLFTASAVAGNYQDAVTVTVTNTTVTTTADVEVIPGPASKVIVNNNSLLTISCADNYQFSAVVTDSCGNEVEVNDPIVFSLSTGSKAGLITADGAFTAGPVPGKYSSCVIAKAGLLSGKASVTVVAPPPTRVALLANKVAADDTMDVAAGGKLSFSAVGYDALDRPITGLKFKFSVDAAIGKISTSGSFTAATLADNAGNVTAQALINGAPAGDIASTTITIVPAVASKVVIDPATASVACAETQQFSASVADKYGNPIEGRDIIWAAAAKAGTIDADGLFTAGSAPGKYSGAVTATCDKYKGSATVTVVPPPPTSVKLLINKVETGAFEDILAGAKINFTALGYDALERPITGLKFRFAATGNCGTINATSGAFAAATASGSTGSVTAQAYINNALVGEVGEVTVNVLPTKASKVVITPANTGVVANDTQLFEASVQDMYSNIIEDADVTWTAVASAGTIDGNGLFTAGSTPGKFTSAVTATSGTLKASATVTITPQPPVQVKLMINGVDAASEQATAIAGSSITLKPEAYDMNDAKISYLTFSYKVDGEVNIGSITTAGIYTVAKTAGDIGSIEIQPLYSGAPCGDPWYATVYIAPAAPKTVTIDPASVSLSYGNTSTFTVQSVTDAYDNIIDDADITWTLSSATAGTLTTGEISSSILFTAGETAGKYTVKATAANTAGSAYATATINVLSESALEHLQKLVNDDTTPDIPTEYDWFSKYVSSNPTDNVGILGLSITKFMKSVYTLATKYGMPESDVAPATTFRSALALAASSDVTIDQNTVLNIINGNTFFGDSKSTKASFMPKVMSSAFASGNRSAMYSTDPSPIQILSDVKTVLIPALQDAITSISPLTSVEGPIATFDGPEGNQMTIGCEEVLAFRAALRSMVGVLGTVTAYSWDPGTFNWNKSLAQFDANLDGRVTPTEYLPGGTFMTLTSKPLLTTAWTAINGALDDAMNLTERMESGNVDPTRLIAQVSEGADWSKLHKNLDSAADVLAGPVDTTQIESLPPDYQEIATTITINLKAFWTTPITDLRKIMPTFSYITECGKSYAEVYSLPDKTLGGLLPYGAAQLTTSIQNDWFNFFGDEGDWWGYIDPWFGQTDVTTIPDISVYANEWESFPSTINVRLYKYSGNSWQEVPLTLVDSQAQFGFWIYQPTFTLDTLTWYRIYAFCDRGRITSYFHTWDIEAPPGPINP